MGADLFDRCVEQWGQAAGGQPWGTFRCQDQAGGTPTWEVEGADAGGDPQGLADAEGVDASGHMLHVLTHQVPPNASSILNHLCREVGHGVGGCLLACWRGHRQEGLPIIWLC